MKFNDYGLELIKVYERLRLTSYQDFGGIWTIGWGHISDKYFTVSPNQTIDLAKAEELIAYDIQEDAISLLNRELLYENMLNDNQYSALVSLVYNSGSFKIKREGKWIASPLMTALNEKRFGDASDLILTHDITVNGQQLLGLRRRRLAEHLLYNSIIDELAPVEWAKWVYREVQKRLTA